MPEQYNPDNLTQSQLWTLALSALLTEKNWGRHDSLRESANDDVEGIRHFVKRDWSISTREELIDQLDWQIKRGHNRDYMESQNFINALSHDAVEAYINAAQHDEDRQAKLKIVANYRQVLRRDGIQAWDIGRYVSLCRWGVALELLDEKECWDRLFEVAERIQASYQDWYSFAVSYIAGRLYWRGNTSNTAVEEEMHVVIRLTGEANSPWQKLNWHEPLVRYEEAANNGDFPWLVELSKSADVDSLTLNQLVVISQAYTHVGQHSEAYEWAIRAINKNVDEASFARLIAARAYAGQFIEAVQDFVEHHADVDLSKVDNFCKSNLIAIFVETGETEYLETLACNLTWQEESAGAGLIYFNLACYYSAIKQDSRLALKAVCKAIFVGKKFEEFEKEKQLQNVVERQAYKVLKNLYKEYESDSSITLEMEGRVIEYATGRGKPCKYDWQGEMLTHYNEEKESYLAYHSLVLTIEEDINEKPFQIVESPIVQQLAQKLIISLEDIFVHGTNLHEKSSFIPDFIKKPFAKRVNAIDKKKTNCVSCEWTYENNTDKCAWTIVGYDSTENERVLGSFKLDTLIWKRTCSLPPVWRYSDYSKVISLVEQEIDWNELEVSEPFYIAFKEQVSGSMYYRPVVTKAV